MRRFVWLRAVFWITFLTHGIKESCAELDAIQTDFIHRFADQGSNREIRVTLVFSSALEKSIPLLVSKTKLAIARAEERLGLQPREDFAIFFDSEPDLHNGLATVLPSNRIIVQTESPILEDSIGLSSDYLEETITHEVGHMLPLQQRRGVFEFFDKLFGNASRPIGLWPRWMHEGIAVWTEASMGGRPASGYIDLDRRKYAEYYARTGEHPLENTDLDGSTRDRGQHPRVAPGDLPYHFGYLLIDAWARERGQHPLKAFVHEASQNLGASFRPVFRQQGRDLEQVFEDARREWAQTPLTPLDATHETDKILIARSENILGPFSNGHALSWIEIRNDGEKRELKARLEDGQIKAAQWKGKFSLPQQAFLLENGTWLVLARKLHANPARPAYRGLLWVTPKGRIKCELPTPPRLREIDVQGDAIAWTRSQENGTVILESSRLLEGCQLAPAQEIARSREPFERLSQPRFTSSGTVYSRSQGFDSFHEFLELPEGRIAGDTPLSQPWRTDCPSGEELCFVAHEATHDHWGPVLVSKSQGRWSSRRLPLRTGSSHSSEIPGKPGWLAVREEFWEEDRLLLIPVSDFASSAKELRPLTDARPAPASAVDVEDISTHEYSPWPSLWPRFWTPTFAAVPGGYLAMGETFFQDLTNTWSGTALLGYDSSVTRPFLGISLNRRAREHWIFSDYSATLSYQPVYNYRAPQGSDPAQDRWGTSLSATTSHLFTNEWMSALTPRIQYLGSANAVRVEGFNYIVPSVSMSLRSPYGVEPFSMQRLPERRHSGVYLSEQVGWIKKAYSNESLNAHAPLGKTAIETTLQHGWISQENFPALYFEWGGLPSLATTTEGYLSRGFQPRMAAGQSILRVAAQWGFTLVRPNAALSWNRSRLTAIDSRWIVESVSFTPFNLSSAYVSPYKMGKQFFTSVGSELDFWSSALHYVNFTASAGYFHGFGHFGDDRVSLTLRGWIDL